MDILDLKEDEGIICNNPVEREAIKDLMWKAVKWPEKNEYNSHKVIVLFPVNKAYCNEIGYNPEVYKYFEAKLFLNKEMIYETWAY